MADADRCRRATGRLLGKVRRACRRWALLPDDGGIAVAVSGGWDSLALLLLLAELRSSLREPPRLAALHVTLDAGGATARLPEETARFCAGVGVRLEEVEPRLDAAQPPPADCYACARVRRRTLLEAADARGMRSLALGHHADDVVETWLLGLLYTGRGELLAPRRSYFDGAVTVIRPLCELRRTEIHRLGRLCGFPPPPAPCPREGDARRNRVREALGTLGRDERLVRRTVFWAAMRSGMGGAGSAAL